MGMNRIPGIGVRGLPHGIGIRGFIPALVSMVLSVLVSMVLSRYWYRWFYPGIGIPVEALHNASTGYQSGTDRGYQSGTDRETNLEPTGKPIGTDWEIQPIGKPILNRLKPIRNRPGIPIRKQRRNKFRMPLTKPPTN